MEQRLANSVRISTNEKKFIENGLLAELRVDGRQIFDYRDLLIDFGREDGQAMVRLGKTRAMSVVTSELVQPYEDRPNEGTLSVFTEFSPMADCSFEAGRPGEFAVEIGRIIDRGLRESWALDLESLCVISGKFVWAIRVDLHILDNGGNLIDAANAAVLASLSTFRRPDCSIEGVEVPEVIIHPPEERETLPLIIHHFPIAITFGIFNEGNSIVIDPTYLEESILVGRITVTVNSNDEICALQKAGGEGMPPHVITLCLRIAAEKAAEVCAKIEKSVDSYNNARSLRQMEQYASSSSAMHYDDADIISIDDEINELRCRIERWKSGFNGTDISSVSSETKISEVGGRKINSSLARTLNWNPYSDGISSELLKKAMVPPGTSLPRMQQGRMEEQKELDLDQTSEDRKEALHLEPTKRRYISLKDAVKPKGLRRRRDLVKYL